MATAILIDGGFFLYRHYALRGSNPPKSVASDVHWMCRQHLKHDLKHDRTRKLYRIFFYDCPPLSKKVHNPVSGKSIDFSKSATALWRADFHRELCKLRKVALRLGYLNERSASWTLKSDSLKKLLRKEIGIDDLTESDVTYSVKQKGVDMRIGLDIASMAYKRQVDQIVLVAGDSDFVPAAKLARREGIDFILDPMWASIRNDLHEHIDGLHSVFKRPAPTKSPTATPPVTPPPLP